MDPADQWFHVDVMTMTPDQKAPLSAADRCDRCGAQAYVRVTLPSGELLFCAHHYREHAPKFADVATHLHDETDRLLTDRAGATL
jgi:formylmethanofuran dehydrogenase subunit E